jgi:hypothetical protein
MTVTLLYRKCQSNGYSITLAISGQRISYHLAWLEKFYKARLKIKIILTLINVAVIIFLKSNFVREVLQGVDIIVMLSRHESKPVGNVKFIYSL